MKVRTKPEKKIKYYIESFFENVYYSQEIYDIKLLALQKINEEYVKEKENNKKNAFEVIVQKYNSLESIVRSVDNSVEIEKWFSKKEITTTYNRFKEELTRKKIHIYFFLLLCIFFIESLISGIMYRNGRVTFFFISFISLAIIIFFIYTYHNDELHKEVLSVESERKLEKLFDSYSKRCLIWFFILFFRIYDILFNMISVSINSKTSEVFEELKSGSFSFDFILFFFLKNIIIMYMITTQVEYENTRLFKKFMIKIFLCSMVYLLIAFGISIGFEKIFVFNPIFYITMVYFIFAIVGYFIGVRNFTYRKKGLNLYFIIPLALVLLVGGGYLFLSRDIWLIQPIINSTPYIYQGNSTISYNEKTGIFTIVSEKDDFKMLQITDIHLGGGVISLDKDKKAMNAVFELINHTKPDLVVVTGDLTYPVGLSSFSFNNEAPVAQFAAFMRNTGVPWVFTFGNHDTESMAIGSEQELNNLYKSLSWETSKNLLYPYIQPKVNGKQIMGRNNQLLELRNKDGTLNQALFLIDSNAYMGSGFSKYDYIHDDQVEWYKNEIQRLNREEGKLISSLVFFHIPLQQYKIAYDLFMEGSDEVKYYFGFNGEKTKEKVCASKYPSKLFDTVKELNSTKALFCGHDHYNNLSLEYQGIRLTYGMSIDYLVEPGIARDTKQRGATLIISHKDSSVDIEQVPLTSIQTNQDN